jgi:hypothetical protein
MFDAKRWLSYCLLLAVTAVLVLAGNNSRKKDPAVNENNSANPVAAALR